MDVRREKPAALIAPTPQIITSVLRLLREAEHLPVPADAIAKSPAEIIATKIPRAAEHMLPDQAELMYPWSVRQMNITAPAESVRL